MDSETRRPRRGGKKRFLLPLALLCLAMLLPGALLPPSASASSSSPAAGGGSRKRRLQVVERVHCLQWPGTICRETSNCCDTNGCCRSKPLKWFTIHGLWPQYSYGGWPSCCRPTKFNINKILMLKPILERYWPSLYCGSSSSCFGGKGPFWMHEMKTHGTCAYPEIQDEYDYFSTALYLYSKYNVTKAMRKAQIRPASGRKYAVGRIVAVIEYAFGVMPSLICKNGSVQELRLCFHKDYQPRDCTVEAGTAPNSRSYCPRYVTFPSYKPSVMANATEGISNQTSKPMASYSEWHPGVQVLK